jgi:pimeloyl-ACP methyl ester carboxylesterase
MLMLMQMQMQLTLASLGLMATIGSRVVMAQSAGESSRIRNVVLVHGAWADGSSFAKIIPLLLARGYHVTAVQNPLLSLAEDVAATRRAIEVQDGPVILVGHSWAGTVITEAGTDPKVAGLVYIAAFAPDEGQSVLDATKGYPATPGVEQAKPDAEGYLWLSRQGVDEDFGPDLPSAERDLAYVTQVPWNSKALSEKVTAAAWKTKPTWFVVAANDRMIAPAYERAVAAQMHATTTTLVSSHVAMLSHPRAVADVIIDAATKAGARSVAAGGR